MRFSPRVIDSSSNSVIRFLPLLGMVSCALYGAILFFSFQYRYGEGHANRPILEVLSIFWAATLVYLIALFVVLRGNNSILKTVQERSTARSLRLILFFSLLFRLILLPSVPIQEIDYYRYLWDGRVLASGLNPFRFSPQQVEVWGPSAPPSAEVGKFWRVANSSEEVRTVFARVHHRHVPTVYPPAAQFVFASAAFLTPAQAPLWFHLLMLKLLLVGFDVGTLFLLVALLRLLQLPPTWCLAYGWCPLALKEVANSAHLDSIAVFFTTLALVLLVKAFRKRETESSWSPLGGATAAFAALGIGVLAKSYPIILLPVTGAFVLSRIGVRALLPLAVCLAVIAAGYLPFQKFGQENENPAKSMKSYSVVVSATGNALPGPSPHHPFQGLGTFLTQWQMNDLLFMIVHENLRLPVGESDQWFVFLPVSIRQQLHATALSHVPRFIDLSADVDPAFLATQGLMGLLLFILCVSWAWRVYRQPVPMLLLRASFLTLAWGWLLSSAPNPWYLLWSFPLMVFAGRRSWFMLPGLALLYYLRFYLEYQALGDAAQMQAARNYFDYVVVWFEFLPFFLILLAESGWNGLYRVSEN